MSHPFIFLCPACKEEDTINKNSCGNCGVKLIINTDYLSIDDRIWTFSELLSWMNSQITINQTDEKRQQKFIDFTFPEEPNRISKSASLRQGIVQIKYCATNKIFSRTIEKPIEITKGQLVLLNSKFYFYSKRQLRAFDYQDLTCVTTNGNYFVFKIKYQQFYQIKFQHESPLKYEVIFQKILNQYYLLDRIQEFQPKIRLKNVVDRKKIIQIPKPKKIRFSFWIYLIRIFLINLLKLFFLVSTRISITGKQNFPSYKPYFVLANHQSVLDPFFILAYLSSEVAFLTKSTSFIHWYEKLFLKLGRGIPTTRYQTDPMVVLNIRQVLSLGIPIGIFPEGERCWDGQRQKFKVSVIKLLAATRQPIVPIVLKNTFGLLPRWRLFPKHQKIKILVKPAFSLVTTKFNYNELRSFLEKQFD
jgi:1-acyl-sn-glycerol-3-phosphate acyltransferase